MANEARPSTVVRRRGKSARRRLAAAMKRGARLTRRAMRTFLRAPKAVQALSAVVCAVALWFALNWIYQVVRKPSELFFPVSGTLNKTPPETWRQYGPLFEQYSTQRDLPRAARRACAGRGLGQPGGADLLALGP